MAKRYKDKAISNDVYFHDVKMQMEAKMWALNYNGRGPARKVDMIQVSACRGSASSKGRD